MIMCPHEQVLEHLRIEGVAYATPPGSMVIPPDDHGIPCDHDL